MVATLATLLLVPSLFALFHRNHAPLGTPAAK